MGHRRRIHARNNPKNPLECRIGRNKRSVSILFLADTKHTPLKEIQKMLCTKASPDLVVVVVGLGVVLFFTHSATNLANASLLVTEQASSSSDTDKEIAFISANGSHLDDSKTTSSTATGDVAVTSRPSRERPLKRSRRYLDFIEGSRMIVGIATQMEGVRFSKWDGRAELY